MLLSAERRPKNTETDHMSHIPTPEILRGGTTRSYYYDNGVVVFTEDGSSISSANILADSGAVVGSYRGSTYHNYLTDMQGSTTNIVKEDGNLSAAYIYTDFGETTEITGGSFDNQICYTGGIYDKETDLYYLNARYYDPETGRFISQDTYRVEMGDSGQWHLYTYCANNPINYVDPSGHKPNPSYSAKEHSRYKWSTIKVKFNQLEKLAKSYDSDSFETIIAKEIVTTARDEAIMVYIKNLGWKKFYLAVKKFAGPYSYYSYMKTYTEFCQGLKKRAVAKGIRKFNSRYYGKVSGRRIATVSVEYRYVFKERYELTGKVSIKA